MPVAIPALAAAAASYGAGLAIGVGTIGAASAFVTGLGAATFIGSVVMAGAGALAGLATSSIDRPEAPCLS